MSNAKKQAALITEAVELGFRAFANGFTAPNTDTEFISFMDAHAATELPLRVKLMKAWHRGSVRAMFATV